jgi:hypothetical protein
MIKQYNKAYYEIVFSDSDRKSFNYNLTLLKKKFSMFYQGKNVLKTNFENLDFSRDCETS